MFRDGLESFVREVLVNSPHDQGWVPSAGLEPALGRV